MERMIRWRVTLLLLLFGLVVGFFALKLYHLQIVETGGNTNNITTFETRTRVKGPRGNLLDTNGNVLVGNRASYDLVINHFVLTSSSEPNETLYQLVQLCKQRGIEYTDRLPVTKETPYQYTLDDYNATWQDYFQTFLLERDNIDSDISASLLMEKLKESYSIPKQWSEEDARLVLGLRYELSLRNYVAALSNYVFLSDVDGDTLAAVMELNIPGMNVETTTVREYTTKYASHILGYVGAMNPEQWEKYKPLGYSMDAFVGQTGLEEAFEEYLHGVDGTRVDVVTKNGELVRSYYETEPQSGKNVQVSIDLNMQSAAEDALARTIADLRDPTKNPEKDGRDAGGAAVVAMDVKTGQVLVCASYPTYDLANLFRDFKQLSQDKETPLYNRALQATYPPGSTYKMSMTVAAIDSGTIRKNTYIEDKGVFTKYAGFNPKCLRYTNSGKTHGSIDATDALKVSCNYFYYVLGDKMDIWDIDATAKALGLGEKSGVELSESLGHRSNPETKEKIQTGENKKWYQGDQVLTAIGQSENKFTPIQLCSYTMALANQGTRYKATFLDRVISSDYRSVFFENTAQVLNKLEMSDDAFQTVKKGMQKCANVSGGTAYKIFKDYPITVCAKTGTAQTGIPNTSDNGAFVCYAPADDPQIAVVVYGEKAGHGSSLGEVARSVLDSYFGLGAENAAVTGENQLG